MQFYDAVKRDSPTFLPPLPCVLWKHCFMQTLVKICEGTDKADKLLDGNVASV